MIMHCRTLAVGLALIGSVQAGSAADLPGGYTCSDLKDTVATYGASVVLAAARGKGIPEHEITRIRRQCKV
jgi:hypothetical protein